MNTPIRVLLVDDHAVVREGYKRLLQDSGRITVVGEATDAAAAYQQFRDQAPDVTIMDISLQGSSGIAALAHIVARDPRARVLIFSMHEDAIFANHALRAGALGYVTKSSAPKILVEAVLKVAAGHHYLSADMVRTATPDHPSDATHPLHCLTSREFEVLRLSLNGASTNAIAETLHLSRKSIANHRWNIKCKTGVDNFLQLLPTAMHLGLLSTPRLPPPDAHAGFSGTTDLSPPPTPRA